MSYYWGGGRFGGLHDVDSGLVDPLSRVLYAGLLSDVDGLLGQQVHRAVDVEALYHLDRTVRDWKHHGVNTDAALSCR